MKNNENEIKKVNAKNKSQGKLAALKERYG